MSWVALGVGVGGAVASTAGGMLSAGAQNRAARQARDFQDRDMLGAQGSLATQLYGSQTAYLPTWQRLLGQAQQHNLPDEASRYARLIEEARRPTANSLLGRMSSLTDQIGQRQQADLGYFDADSARLDSLFGNARNALAGEGNRLNALAAGAEGIARSQGVGRDRIIRQDADRQENAMNQRSRAALSASGLGNTTAVANQMAGNASAVGRQRETALQASQDSRTAAQLAARQGRINTGQQIAGQVYGADVTRANAATNRSTNRLGLTQAHLANDQQLRLMPIQTELGTQQGAVMNPSHTNATAYYPGASGAANALSSFGNTATSAGGLLAVLQQLGLGQPTNGQRNAFNNVADYMNIPGYVP